MKPAEIVASIDEDTEMQTYVSEQGENVHDISMRYNLPPSVIISLNNLPSILLPEGTKLRFPTAEYVITKKFPIFAINITETKELPGYLYVDNEKIGFSISSREYLTNLVFQLDIVGILDVRIMVHHTLLALKGSVDYFDPSFPANMSIVYLRDVFDQTSIEQKYFSGLRCDLHAIMYSIQTISSRIQQKINFIGPSLNPTRGIIRKPLSIPFGLVGGSTSVLNDKQIEFIRLSMPNRYRMCSWRLAFSTMTDGVSIRTLYTRGEKLSAAVLVIKTNQGSLGAFLSTGLIVQKKYHGTGETYVFSCSEEVEVFKWKQKNQLFMSSTPSELMIGGPEPAIYMDSTLLNGYSNPCETFGSPVLTKTSRFSIFCVELWEILPLSFKRA